MATPLQGTVQAASADAINMSEKIQPLVRADSALSSPQKGPATAPEQPEVPGIARQLSDLSLSASSSGTESPAPPSPSGAQSSEDLERELDALLLLLVNKTVDNTQKATACFLLAELLNRTPWQLAESFRKRGGYSALSSLLKSDDEGLLDAAASALTNLSSTSMRRPAEKEFWFSGGFSVICQELKFSDSGTAYNIWTAALVLAQWMVMDDGFKDWVGQGQRVLELGSGLGVCGVLAAKLGADVTLSDFVPCVLENLESTLKRNQVGGHVSRLDWCKEAGISGAQSSNHGWYGGSVEDNHDLSDKYCHLPSDQTFDVIIGSDICYEEDHPDLLHAVLFRRLRPGGKAVLLYAVRFPNLHERLLANLKKFCTEVEATSVDSESGELSVEIIEEGCTQHSSYYKGGMQLVVATR